MEVDDPGVSVSINGEEVVITGTGAKEIRLKPGQYKVLALKKGKLVRQEAVTITRNGRQVVRVDGEAESVTENTRSSEHFTQMTDSDRKAAEYVLSIGGAIRVHGMDGDIKSAADLPQQPFELATIVLRGNQQVTDEGLANCLFCKQLTRLDLVRTPVTDAGLAHFAASRKLVILDLVHTSIGDAGLASFQGITTLRHL